MDNRLTKYGSRYDTDRPTFQSYAKMKKKKLNYN